MENLLSPPTVTGYIAPEWGLNGFVAFRNFLSLVCLMYILGLVCFYGFLILWASLLSQWVAFNLEKTSTQYHFSDRPRKDCHHFSLSSHAARCYNVDSQLLSFALPCALWDGLWFSECCSSEYIVHDIVAQLHLPKLWKGTIKLQKIQKILCPAAALAKMRTKLEVVPTRSESGKENHEGQELYMAADHKLSVLTAW